MTPEHLKAWRLGHKWSRAVAAEQLGISERSLDKYETPGGEVPRVVELAVIGHDAVTSRNEALAGATAHRPCA